MRTAIVIVGLSLSSLAFAGSGRERAVRSLDAFVSSLVVTYGVKSVVREERPNHEDSRSFPSEHATAASALATVQAYYDPDHAALWYLGAAAVDVWRVSEKEHFGQDVLAGSLIGYLTARAAVTRPRGLLVTPLFGSRSIGLSVMARY